MTAADGKAVINFSDPSAVGARGVDGTSRSTGALDLGDSLSTPTCQNDLSRRMEACEQITDPELRALCIAGALAMLSECIRRRSQWHEGD